MKELFDNRIITENIIFKHANGKSVESGKEFHSFYEIIYFLEGDAEFISENIHINIKPHTLVIVPKETYHRVIIHGNQERYHRCIINIYDTPDLVDLIEKSLKCQIVLFSDKDIEVLFEKLMKNTNNENAKLLLNAIVILLLDTIAEKNSFESSENRQNLIIKKALKYINDNIDRKITVDEIAKNCMVSESSLSHIFKEEFNITVHKFIIKKKLINAYNKINAGVPATVAAIECGFGDYSGFYKQYKKMFNKVPSEKTGQLTNDI